MLVSELFRSLSFGPLSNLSIGMDGAGEIAPAGQGKIISFANSGLMRLYSRFTLSEKEVIIRMIEGVSSYYLLKRFSEFKCSEEEEESEDNQNNQFLDATPPYIMDLLNPFEEDVIKVLQVRDSLGNDLPLNDLEDPFSTFTPSPTLLQVPTVITCQALGVVYQAKHPTLELGVLSAKISLPETLHEALLAYIAHKVYSGMNGQDNISIGEVYRAEYERVCDEVLGRDLVNSSSSSSTSLFHERGFV